MDAKELMIGDWVSYIPEIEEGEDSYLGEPRNVQVDLPCLERIDELIFAPIPLTPKILEKNGFTIGYGEHSGNEGLIDDVNKHYYVKVGRWGNHKNEVGHCEVWNVCIDQHSPIYVHEVQHSLRQCRQYELADNFKV